ncbi:hypothetical protein ALC57_04947, partial [Trachymyrmex cornetzi]
INLSNVTIPKKVQCLLQMGNNFALPSYNIRKNCIELIKNLENNVKNLGNKAILIVRNQAIGMIDKLVSTKPVNNMLNKKLRYLFSVTKQFIKNNQEVVFTRADKGNVTVALNINTYKDKMNDMLKDRSTYTMIERDPTKQLTDSIRSLLTEWVKFGYIESNTYKKIYNSDGILPLAYGLLKIHKLNCPYNNHKPTCSDRYLSFLSAHPISQKRGALIGVVDRVFLLSHPRFHEDNLNWVIQTFLGNDYPMKFIFETLNRRLKALIRQKTGSQVNSGVGSETVDITPSWFIMPYFPHLYNKFKNLTKNISVKLGWFSLNKLQGIIKGQKDVRPTDSNKNVVYKIKCKDCNASYVGQTKRKLKTRITEHKNNIKWKSVKPSVITEHRRQLGHEFDWENIEICDREGYYNKRMISEMLYINTQWNGLDLKSDTEFLHHAYSSTIEKIFLT